MEGLDNSHLLTTSKTDVVDSVNLEVKDRLHQYQYIIDNQKTLITMNEMIFYGAFVYYYYFGPIQDTVQTFIILKNIIIIFILRYLFNYITNYTKSETQVNYQINSKIAIFTILVLFLSNTSHDDNVNLTSLLLIIAYTLLSSSAGYGYTVDNILTLIIIYSLYKSKMIN